MTDTTEPTPYPTRKTAWITVELCVIDACFAAIPVEQLDTHAKWHTEHRGAA